METKLTIQDLNVLNDTIDYVDDIVACAEKRGLSASASILIQRSTEKACSVEPFLVVTLFCGSEEMFHGAAFLKESGKVDSILKDAKELAKNYDHIKALEVKLEALKKARS